MLRFIILALMGFALVSSMRSYQNYKIYKVVPKTEGQVQMLTDLRKQGYDFWTEVFTVNDDVRIMVSPEQDNEFVAYTNKVGLEPKITVNNLEDLITAQLQPAKTERNSRLGSFTWDRYHTLDEIHSWLDELVELYPGIVTTINIGQSFENRDIKGVIIDFKADSREGTPLIGMIEGGIHAREWISPATVTWIIKEFLTSTNEDVRFMAETFVWHIFPVINPDGYDYTFQNDRMWRKNRNPNNFVNCTINIDRGNGIDLNRNFNFLWMTTGASSDPCQETYAGPIPASELEAQAIMRYVLNLKQIGNVIYYFAFHSYSQMILVPYSHVSGVNVLEAPNYADMYEVAIRGAEKLTAVHGTQYTVGTSAEILYEVSGSSFDWAKGVAEIPIVYLFELRDVGAYGFLLPTDQIIPNNEEIMACLLEMDKTTRQLNYYEYSSASSVVVSIASLFFSMWFLVLC